MGMLGLMMWSGGSGGLLFFNTEGRVLLLLSFLDPVLSFSPFNSQTQCPKRMCTAWPHSLQRIVGPLIAARRTAFQGCFF
jgi:hypothetical protein